MALRSYGFLPASFSFGNMSGPVVTLIWLRPRGVGRMAVVVNSICFGFDANTEDRVD